MITGVAAEAATGATGAETTGGVGASADSAGADDVPLPMNHQAIAPSTSSAATTAMAMNLVRLGFGVKTSSVLEKPDSAGGS